MFKYLLVLTLAAPLAACGGMDGHDLGRNSPPQLAEADGASILRWTQNGEPMIDGFTGVNPCNRRRAELLSTPGVSGVAQCQNLAYGPTGRNLPRVISVRFQ